MSDDHHNNDQPEANAICPPSVCVINVFRLRWTRRLWWAGDWEQGGCLLHLSQYRGAVATGGSCSNGASSSLTWFWFGYSECCRCVHDEWWWLLVWPSSLSVCLPGCCCPVSWADRGWWWIASGCVEIFYNVHMIFTFIKFTRYLSPQSPLSSLLSLYLSFALLLLALLYRHPPPNYHTIGSRLSLSLYGHKFQRQSSSSSLLYLALTKGLLA